ncbi:MAG: PorP/SprF family type IX secretion system membrane protein [Bacteroidetes bacterium]|nr:PorP/SprF family type IX secretion system membrane protein [Bacteroidota bacterium]MBS1649729.1 PorP/SprF family type IX secretion system membrane protein [Bacteroidota bacterium]
MKHIVKHIIILFFVFNWMNINAQDLHFSQYFNAPLLVNPANTGFITDYDYRIGGNYRNQWANFGNAYKTMSIWADGQLFYNKFENGWIGLGGALLKDEAGGGTLTATRGFFSAAYHQVISDNGLLSIGAGFGMVNKRVDVSKLVFNNQWNGQFFDITIPSNEPFFHTSIYYTDLQIGVNYAAFISDNLYLNAGISAFHINQPSESFFAASSTANTQLNPRLNFFLNAQIKIQNLWIVNPNIYVSKMGSATETVIGLNANRNLSGDGSNQLILGLYYRNNDAIIPVIGYELNNYKLTFNYDATISSVNTYNAMQGAYEVSIIKSGIWKGGDKSIKCPKMVRF